MFLADDAEELFRLTTARIKEPHQSNEKSKRPIRKVHVFSHHEEKNHFNPDVDKVICKMNEREVINHVNIRTDAFKDENKRFSQKITRIKRGVPLTKILREESPRYTPVNITQRYSNFSKKISEIPEHYNNILYKMRSVDFVEQIVKQDPKSENTTQNIDCSEKSINKLRKIISASDEITQKLHNEMIDHLNHTNERRERAMKVFYEESYKFGFNKARARYQRASQRSRLRVMGKFPWWEEFIQFAYKKKVGQDEKHLIEVLSREEILNSTRFASIMHDVEKNVENPERCIELLNWINKKCKIIDEHITALIDDTPTALSPIRTKTLTRRFSPTKTIH